MTLRVIQLYVSLASLDPWEGRGEERAIWSDLQDLITSENDHFNIFFIVLCMY